MRVRVCVGVWVWGVGGGGDISLLACVGERASERVSERVFKGTKRNIVLIDAYIQI